MSDAERIRLEITAEAEQLRRELRTAAAEVKAFGAETEKASKRSSAASTDAAKAMGLWRDQAGRWRNEAGQFASASEKAAAGLDKVSVSNRRGTSTLKELRQAVSDVNKAFALKRNLMSTLKWPVLITGAGLGAQALNSLAAGGAAAGSALAPLVGLVPAAAQGALAAGQATGTWKLATEGLSEALGGNEKALKKLTPEARAFLDVLKELQGDKAGLQRTAQAELFPGLEAGIESARKNLPALNSVVGETASTLGHLGAQAGELVGSKGFGKDLEVVGERNTRVMARAGRAGLDLTNVVRDLVVEAGPLTNWLSLSAARFAHLVEQETHAARQSGELAHFFDETRDSAEHLASIAGSLAGGLWEVGKAAAPLGRDILKDLDTAAQHWEEWTRSVEGQNELRQYFQDAKPTLYEAAQLVDDLVTGILKFGSTPEMADLIHKVRTELLPILLQVVEQTTAAFGPHLVDALVAVAKVLGDLAGSSGPLVLFVDTIKIAAEVLHDLLQDVPGLQSAVVSLAGAASIYKALQIGAALTGLGKIRSLLTAVKVEGAGAAAIGAAGAAGGLTKGSPLAKTPGKLAGGLSAAGRALPIAGAAVIGIEVYANAKQSAEVERHAKALGKVREALKGKLGNSADWKSMGDAIAYLNGHLRSMKASEFVKLGADLKTLGLDAKSPKKDIRAAADEFDRLADKARAVQKLGREGVSITVDAKVTARGADAVATALHRMRTASYDSVKNLKADVDLNMRLIARSFRDGSAEGKEALAQNFRNAAKAVKHAMDDGVISTKQGLKLIDQYMRSALAEYGIKGKQATRYLNGQDTLTGKSDASANSGVAGAQRGMLTLGRPGAVGPDSIPLQVGAKKVIAAPGEDVAVINRHQRAVLDERLRDMGGLPGLFRTVNQEHMQPMARYARGGLVQLGRSLQRRGYQVSEQSHFGGVHPVHVAGSLHYQDKALDVNADGRPGGEAHWLDRLAAELKAAHWHVLWRVKDHFDHLHVDTAGGGGGAMRAAMIKRVLAKGVGGTLGQVVQGSLDVARRGAQARLDQITATVGGEPGEPSLSGGPWEKVLEEEAKQRGWNANDWRWIVAHESSGRVGAKNPTSTAFGLGQLLDSTYGKYGGGPGSSGAEQVHAMAAYIADRYDNPTRAKAFWQAHNWYQAGGLIEAQAGTLVGAAAPAGAGLKGGLPHKPGHTPVGGKLRQKLKEIAEIAKVTGLGTRLERLRATYSNLEREQAISQEQQTKTAKVRDLTDGQLQALGVKPGDIPRLRQSPDQDVEVRDEQQIGQHVGELDQLLGMQGDAGRLLGEQRDAANTALRRIAKGIEERRQAEQAIQAKAAKNIQRIRELAAEVNAMDDAVRKAKKPAQRRALHRQQAGRRRRIARELDGLRDENQRLVGSRSVNADLGDGATGRLRVVRDSLTRFRAARDELAPLMAPVTGEIPQALEDVRLSVAELTAERRTWTDTRAPDVSVPDAQGRDDSQIADLLREQLADARRAQALSAGQFGALTGFAQLLGGRFVGSFAHGTMRVPETGLALVHRDERIIPDVEGPYGSQVPASGGPGGSGSVLVELHFDGDSGELVKLVDARINKQAARAATEQTGRRTRVLIAAPGGR